MNKPPYGNAIRQLDNTKQFKVSAQDIPNKTVKVSAGVFTSSTGTIIEFQGGVSAPIAIDRVPQWVLVSVGISNNISLRYDAVVPAVEKDHIACALLYVKPTHTIITNDMIFDIRSLYNPHQGTVDQPINIDDIHDMVNGKADLDGTDSNIFTLNKNQFGLPASDATIEVNRGSAPNVGLRWSESRKFWEYTNDGYEWFGFDNSASIGLATDVERGIVLLSTEADNVDDPIAVGTNDTRMMTFHQKNEVLDHLVDSTDPHKTLVDNAVKFNHLSLNIGDRLLVKDTTGLITETLNISTPDVAPAFVLSNNNNSVLIVGLNAQLLNGHDDQYFSTSTHNHDLLYSQLSHNHDLLYSPFIHNHNAVYSLLGHNHDLDYANINHNHDLVYSSIAHDHNLLYSSVTHKHDLDYASLSHNHDLLYSSIAHDHNLLYSSIVHKHDLDYASLVHAHSEYALSTDVSATYATKLSLGDYPLKTELSIYATTEELANYATTAALANYATIAELDLEYVPKTSLADYALAAELQGYAKIATLADYVPTTELANYTTTADLSANYASKILLGQYAKNTDLGLYAQTTDVATTYATKLELSGYAQTTALASYTTTTDLAANYATKLSLDSYAKTADLSAYATKTELVDYVKTTDLAAYALKTDLPTGASGQFTSADGKTITVTNGIITAIA